MVTTSIQVSKPQGNVKASKPATGQHTLFYQQLPLNFRIRDAALEQLENDFWMMLDCQTQKSKASQLRLMMENFDRDFARAQRLGLKASDIMSSIIGALFEDQALVSLYYNKKSKTAKNGKKSKKGGKKS